MSESNGKGRPAFTQADIDARNLQDTLRIRAYECLANQPDTTEDEKRVCQFEASLAKARIRTRLNTEPKMGKGITGVYSALGRNTATAK